MRFGKSITGAATVAMLVAGTAAPVSAESRPALAVALKAPAPKVKAKSALMYDGNKKVWARAANTRRPIASLTKVMTAVVVLNAAKGKLSRQVKIKKSHTVAGVKYGATRSHLVAGDRVTVKQLLQSILIESGADGAAALADTYGKNEKGFVKKMNATAKRLGLKKTRYYNPTGLPYPTRTSNYSTATEQVKLTRYAMKKFPVFRSIVATSRVNVKTPGKHTYTFKTTNNLLKRYRGAIGIKTGYTDAAQGNLLFAAKRGKRTLIGVVLGSPKNDAIRVDDRFKDAANLMDWAFGVRASGYRTATRDFGVSAD